MIVEDLTDLQVELLLARIMGHHAHLKYGYVHIDDWNKEGTLVDGYRFEPTTDEPQCRHIQEREGIQTMFLNGEWNAAISHIAEVATAYYFGATTEFEAIVRCKVHSVYPDEVPEDMLQENPL